MHLLRFAAVAALCLATLGAPASAATAPPMVTLPQHQALMVVRQFVSDFNAGNMNAALAMCAPSVAIVDEIPPHTWQGPSACGDWARDLAAADRAAGITDGRLTLGIPWQVAVDGNYAYLVLPATYAYKQHGRPTIESGSLWTFVLGRNGGNWRIVAWTWSARSPS